MQAIGVASKDTVPDSSFSASSEFSNTFKASNGRLNGTSAWAPSGNNNATDYLQIDLGYEFTICAVATQGSGKGALEWTTVQDTAITHWYHFCHLSRKQC